MNDILFLPVGTAARRHATEGIDFQDADPSRAALSFLRAAEESKCLVGTSVYTAHASRCFRKAGEAARALRFAEVARDSARASGRAALQMVQSVLYRAAAHTEAS